MLSLIIPVYRNEGSLPDLLLAVDELNSTFDGALEVVFVIDGSPDKCYEILMRELPSQKIKSQLILLSKNFGSFMAIRTGLQYATGEYFAVMAADLQEPPDLIVKINQALHLEEIDVVVAAREGRHDPLLSKLLSKLYWWFYRKYVIHEIPAGGVDMFGCNKEFRDTLLTLDERHSSLIGQIFWLGFRRKTVFYKRQTRQHGKSAWTFAKKLNYLMDSIFSFTDLPIRILIRVGAGGALLVAMISLVVVVARLRGLIEVPGYAMTILIITFLGCLNLLGLGIVGSYAWRTYENTKNRPLAIPMRVNVFRKVL